MNELGGITQCQRFQFLAAFNLQHSQIQFPIPSVHRQHFQFRAVSQSHMHWTGLADDMQAGCNEVFANNESSARAFARCAPAFVNDGDNGRLGGLQEFGHGFRRGE